MIKNMTKWLGVVDNTESEETVAVNSEGEEKVVEKQPEEEKTEKSDEGEKEEKDQDGTQSEDIISPETKQALEDASAKAIETAKEWGSYLYSFGKQATEKVTEQAKMISKKVEEKTFLGEFSKEQDKFVTEKSEKEKKSEAAVPPWVGYNEEEAMKSQIMALSQDKRNFLRNPPTGIQFQFEFDTVFPVAMATLQEDPNLQKMRFELVPKQIKEATFWRNYFYRVSLIKQSTQLTSLTQQTEKSSSQQEVNKPVKEEEEITTVSPQDNEFVSDAFQDQISEEDLKKEMEMLGVEDKETAEDSSDAIPEWEQELQQDLQDYELVNNGSDIDDVDIENEILKQIEQEASIP